MKNISILGSTGSIGTQTIAVARENEDIRIVAIACGSNIELAEAQARELLPELIVVYEEAGAKELRVRLADLNIRVSTGMDGLIEAATIQSADMVVSAIVGMISIIPTIAAIESGKDIALANKETLVCAGHIVMAKAREYGVNIIPVDSEHSAIFQSIQGQGSRFVNKLLLTASGGPFLGKSVDELLDITPEQALRHPNWDMGRRISIDSATLVNKGLEFMEAMWLFDVSPEQIEIVIHPQSIIHSGVEYVDGSIIAQLGNPDMRLPISYALFYPNRRPLSGKRCSLSDIGNMTFYKPDTSVFSALELAYRAAKVGGSLPTVYNAADEMAVELFLDRHIGFCDIADSIRRAMEGHTIIKDPNVDDILAAERYAREEVNRCIQS